MDDRDYHVSSHSVGLRLVVHPRVLSHLGLGDVAARGHTLGQPDVTADDGPPTNGDAEIVAPA